MALDTNLEPGHDNLLLLFIPGDLLSTCPHRHFTHIALLNSYVYPNALRAMQRGSLYHFYDGLWYDSTGVQTHDLPHERQTC